MAFSEILKSKVRALANMRCCRCHEPFPLQVHHIIPQADGGPDTEDNAAPLCATCHDIFGGNPNKQKYIRDCREHWYEQCAKGEPISENDEIIIADTTADLPLARKLDLFFERGALICDRLRQTTRKWYEQWRDDHNRWYEDTSIKIYELLGKEVQDEFNRCRSESTLKQADGRPFGYDEWLQLFRSELRVLSETIQRITVAAESHDITLSPPVLAMNDDMIMEIAVSEARKSASDGTTPLVGAVATRDGKLLGSAYRGQYKPGEHAEYTLLERVLKNEQLAGATVYTTLEPCTMRGTGKIPCVERLIDRKVQRVVVGMLDPHNVVCGKGCTRLREANIIVDMFKSDWMTILEEMNRKFVHTITTDSIQKATEQITQLAAVTSDKSSRAREATTLALTQCAEALKSGRILIPGQEAGYFQRFRRCVEDAPGKESIKAFIRLGVFEPRELPERSWFKTFYEWLEGDVLREKVEIEYIFALRGPIPAGKTKEFVDRYKAFARQIRIVHPNNTMISSIDLRPSIVLFRSQQIVLTHDRGDDKALIEATEWLFPEDYERLLLQYEKIELASDVYFSA